MQKLQTFFRTFIYSIISPKYYADVLAADFSFSLKYFTLFTIFTALFTSIFLILPIAALDLDHVTGEAVRLFPSDLEVHVEKGKVNVNQPLPYTVALPKEIQSESDIPVEKLITFDTNQHIQGAKDFLDQNSLVVVTEDTVYVRDKEDQQVRAYAVPEDIEPFTLNTAQIERWRGTFLSYPLIKNKLYIPLLGLAILSFTLPAFFLVRFFTAVLYSLVVFAVVRIFKGVLVKDAVYPYSKVLQVSLHSLTVVVLLAYAMTYLHFGHYWSSWRYFVVYFFWTLFVFYQAAQTEYVGEVIPPSRPLTMTPGETVSDAVVVESKKKKSIQPRARSTKKK